MKLQSLTTLRLWAVVGIATAGTAAAAMLLLPGRAPAGPDRNSAGAKTIVLLDGYVQSRFEEDNNRFGADRLPPPVRGHDTIRYELAAATPYEHQVLKEVSDLGSEYVVEFVHCTHPLGRKQLAQAPADDGPKVLGITLIAAKTSEAPIRPYSFGKDREPFRKSVEEPIQKRAADDISKLMKGTPVDATIGTWHVAYRPVRASKASCLKCHVGASGGDVLGIMAYAVRPPIKPVGDTPVKAVSMRR
ncbi:MAG TPA: hypothetical protein VKT77_04215 [Chthonomonadaceae bacterium]|nr:hypothetical protein [Chthonomonadaceae bacterium]